MRKDQIRRVRPDKVVMNLTTRNTYLGRNVILYQGELVLHVSHYLVSADGKASVTFRGKNCDGAGSILLYKYNHLNVSLDDIEVFYLVPPDLIEKNVNKKKAEYRQVLPDGEPCMLVIPASELGWLRDHEAKLAEEHSAN